MYLMINGNKHTVSKRIVKSDEIRYLSVTPAPEEVSGVVQMYENSGFLISEDNADAFKRWTHTGTLLVLTNVPEPVPTPTPEPTEATTSDMAQAIMEGVNEI